MGLSYRYSLLSDKLLNKAYVLALQYIGLTPNTAQTTRMKSFVHHQMAANVHEREYEYNTYCNPNCSECNSKWFYLSQFYT